MSTAREPAQAPTFAADANVTAIISSRFAESDVEHICREIGVLILPLNSLGGDSDECFRQAEWELAREPAEKLQAILLRSGDPGYFATSRDSGRDYTIRRVAEIVNGLWTECPKLASTKHRPCRAKSIRQQLQNESFKLNELRRELSAMQATYGSAFTQPPPAATRHDSSVRVDTNGTGDKSRRGRGGAPKKWHDLERMITENDAKPNDERLTDSALASAYNRRFSQREDKARPRTVADVRLRMKSASDQKHKTAIA